MREEALKRVTRDDQVGVNLSQSLLFVGSAILLVDKRAAFSAQFSNAVGDLAIAFFQLCLFGCELGFPVLRRIGSITLDVLEVLFLLEHVHNLLSFRQAARRDEQVGQRAVRVLL